MVNGDETILLGEDHDLVRELVITILRSLGYTVLGVTRAARR